MVVQPRLIAVLRHGRAACHRRRRRTDHLSSGRWSQESMDAGLPWWQDMRSGTARRRGQLALRLAQNFEQW